MIKVNRFDRIDEFLIHIADIALSNPNLDITSNFIYSNLICFGIESESIDNNFKYWIDAFKFKNNINVIRPDNWNYFCQFTNNIENINKQKNIKIFIPQDKKHILKSANLIFEFLADNNITHASLISSVTRVDDIVIKLTNFVDANKIANFVNSNKYIKEGLLEPSPFSMTDGNISYAIDNKVSYNYELSYYISEYVNKLKTQCRLHNISCDDLKDFINVKYQNTFINGKNIKKFLNDRNITTSIVKNVINHMEVTELIITSLDREKNLSHFVSHFDKINNPEYIKKIYDYMYNLINNEIYEELEKPIITNRDKEILLQDAIINTANKYTIDFAKKGLKNYITSNKVSGFTRNNGTRQKIIDNLTNVEALEIVKRYNDGEFNVSKYVDKVVSIDVDELKQDILNEASLRTYEAYGRKQLEFAINNLINNKKFNGFVNDDNVRLHLINKVSPDEVKNIIKNDLLSNNYPGSIIQEKYITLYINKIEKEAKG